MRLVVVLFAMVLSVPPAVAGHLAPHGPPPPPTPTATSGEGFVYVDDTGARVGDGTLRTYRLEVEPATGIDPHVFTAIAEQVLNDERGWTGAADWALQRVADREADIRVVLATPATVDRLCARAGLHTGGRVSCYNGRFAALNVDRWRTGAKAFDGPLREYRRYLLNHEVGHGLGYGHERCPRAGGPAPVMQQQTLTTAPCRPNAWPTMDP
jgi:hypothetical protein